MISILIFAMYVAIGALLASFHYYLKVKESTRCCDAEPSVMLGVFWPIAALFAFGIYFAKTYAEKERESER